METWAKKSLPYVIHKPILRIEVTHSPREMDFVLIPSDSSLGRIRIRFDDVVSYRWSDDCYDSISDLTPKEIPRLNDGEEKGAYPFMEVQKSDWMDSFNEAQALTYRGCKHFKLLSLEDTFDILTMSEPTITPIVE